MGGKRRAQPSGDAQAGASGDSAAAQGGASRKRQTRGLSVQCAAGSTVASVCRQAEPGSILAREDVFRVAV